jgi:hypothetical protein
MSATNAITFALQLLILPPFHISNHEKKEVICPNNIAAILMFLQNMEMKRG